MQHRDAEPTARSSVACAAQAASPIDATDYHAAATVARRACYEIEIENEPHEPTHRGRWRPTAHGLHATFPCRRTTRFGMPLFARQHASREERLPGACAGPLSGGEHRRAGGGARSALRPLTRGRCLSGAPQARSEFARAPPERGAQRSRAAGPTATMGRRRHRAAVPRAATQPA